MTDQPPRETPGIPPYIVPGFGVHVLAPSAEQPGYLGLTTHETRSAEELESIRARGPVLAAQLRETPGFLGAVFFVAGSRMFTLSAWRDQEGPRHTVQTPGPHRDAIDEVLHRGLTLGGAHGLWKSHTMRLLTRCERCETIADSLRTHHHCPRCGSPHPTEDRYL